MWLILMSLLLQAAKVTQQGPPSTWCVLSVPSLSSLGWLQASNPAGCPWPQEVCRDAGSYSQPLARHGTFLNRGLRFTCTGTRGGSWVPSPGGPA